jgi:hypothetical protein
LFDKPLFLIVKKQAIITKQNNLANNNDTLQLIDSYLTNIAATKNFSGGLLIVKDGKKILQRIWLGRQGQKNILHPNHISFHW